MDRLNGFKTYIIAALLAAVAFLSGADTNAVVAVVQGHAPEAAAVLAAGIALGRAIVALFGKLRADGVIRALAVLTFLAVAAPSLTACSSLSAFQQVQPQTPRQALAVAEITYVGAVTAAQSLHQQGILSTDDARNEIVPRLEQIRSGLDGARILIAAGDEAQAGRRLEAVVVLLNALSVELARRRDEATSNRS